MNVTVVTEMRLEKMRPETKLTNAFLLLQLFNENKTDHAWL